jgi:hypothetical protein
MAKSRDVLACLILLIVVLAPVLSAVSALPPLAAATFPVGTIVVPMDGKQADRVHVYGFIHEFLSLTPESGLSRIIEPPDVSMQTSLTPAGAVYQGGPFLIEEKFLTAVNNLLSRSIFSQVTITRLTASFTSNKVFFVRQPTRILVVRGVWGRTDITLGRMGINYTIVSPDAVVANPSIINQYSLVVIDCPGWYGDPAAYSDPAKIRAVYDTITAHVRAGNEVIFTDIAMKDLVASFPGYVNLASGGSGSWVSTVHNAPIGSDFSPEFPSQYYNPGPNPNTVRIFTEGGGYVVSSVAATHTSDVRILMDSAKFGVPFRHAILAFYFPFGNGIVEGLAFHPQQQSYPINADQNGYYAVYQLYGDKFVHGPQLDFIVSATPTSQSVPQGGVATFSVSVTSVGSFSAPVTLHVSGLPVGVSGTFSPGAVTPAEGGTVSSTLTIPTSLSTPIGSYNLTITGTSTFPTITHSITVTLVVTPAPADFVIDAHPKKPVPLIVPQGQCGNITVSVRSIGNFSAPVNLTLSGLPAHVSYQYIPTPITPSIGGSVFSNLSLCPGPDAAPGNYTMTVTGTSLTSPPITHTVDVLLRVPTPVGPNWLIYLILLILLLIALAIALLVLALLLRKRRPPPVAVQPTRLVRARPRFQRVLPVPTVLCRNCGRIIPLNSVYCAYCGRPQIVVPRRPVRMVAQPRRAGVGRRAGAGVVLSIISGILIILNAALLLSPSFYGPPVNWSSIFWWLPTIGPTYAMALGFIIGLVLIMSSIIIVLGQGAIADILIFPFAVFSLIIGGGFIAGMVLGIIGGIFAIMRR